MQKFHIYVPSKGRASNCVTANLLRDSGLDFTVVVEPQDYKEYAKYFEKENLHKLSKNDQGLWWARNSILKLSRKRGEVAHWQMDDDIRKFMVRRDSKNIKVDAKKSVASVEKVFSAYANVGMVAHRYTSFAFAQKTEYSYNQNPCSSILLRNDLEAVWHKGTVDDADFALQVLNKDWVTIITNRELIDTVPHLKQEGGMTAIAKAGEGRKVRFIQLAKDWPGCFTVKDDKAGRPRLYHKRIWSSFPQRPVKNKRSSK